MRRKTIIHGLLIPFSFPSTKRGEKRGSTEKQRRKRQRTSYSPTYYCVQYSSMLAFFKSMKADSPRTHVVGIVVQWKLLFLFFSFLLFTSSRDETESWRKAQVYEMRRWWWDLRKRKRRRRKKMAGFFSPFFRKAFIQFPAPLLLLLLLFLSCPWDCSTRLSPSYWGGKFRLTSEPRSQREGERERESR